MIVIDDYKEGVIYAGHMLQDLESHTVPDEIMEKVKAYIDSNGLPVKAVHFDSRGFDFYLTMVDDNKLYDYMSARGCDNFIYGV